MTSGPPRGAPSLAVLLGTATTVVFALAALRSLGGSVASRTLDADPGVRVVGVTLVAVGWWILRLCPRVSTGTRRVAARVAAVGLVAGGTVHLAGPGAVADVHIGCLHGVPDGTASWVGAMVLAVLTLYAWLRSPTRR